jgi:putative endonuclease
MQGGAIRMRHAWRKVWNRFWRLYLRPRTLGERGELAAKKYLKRLGYIILAHSSRGPFGELDLIAVDGKTVVFVEVKTRTSHDTGHPADAVDPQKQRRLTRLAMAYLKRHNLLDSPARFDIVAITWPDVRKPPVIEHFKNAFEPTEKNSFFG